ncbi:MAG: DNA-directed RNA polymerase subunit alpha [Candidatus Brocadia sp. AMX2]|uniref:DNA-directed RNA polymerase subunit alpha n=1 Tax=Candidatus Brocadia sinica JPN1 TaxID=1197129 RepID=A0ABQ0JYB2_9BACT|nr:MULTISPECIES: DNA-directed RNA polymerase subunit alpha [Brocadia]MBC6932908.1 DNA-directed RNA polymerase subunit alpha [Candidatus Brocadia sp.]MBL1167606.1 DNA-directed RNA polymerase subunit alpha [Candidatus Brocadia sp. AMX1]NOG40505.1 DNA-directed RNA polymerase subunit alpha [Planctomycetota bacterium]GIK13520.1 MAG: DNA-directed RNA polymerase subunit alpha [Candidatus Brocadia sinica]KAA0242067.1 MAG: DNA-directed RNA polymerase subunit alpha [Candidatus Brocadia sp. AMX2]
MRIRWRGLELPVRVDVEKETLTDKYGKFIAAPFERGFGHSIGNSLRRILLSSLEGSAVVSVKINSVSHEFTTISGVVEDVADIILNIKNLVVKLHTDQPKVIRIDANKKGEVKAKDIITDASVEVVNGDLHIATLSEDINFTVEMEVRKGRGYVTAEENEPDEQEFGLIPVDSLFSPVRNVRYTIEETRVGRRTNYDKLVMEIFTNSVVSPEMALVEAAKIMRKHLNPFVQYFEIGRELQQVEKRMGIESVSEISEEELNKKLGIPITELDLSVRASNCLETSGIATVGDLVAKTEEQLLKIKNFGKTTLKEVKAKLSQLNLSIGMPVAVKQTEEGKG